MVGPAGQLVKVLDMVAQADGAAERAGGGKVVDMRGFRGYLLVQGCLLAAHGRPRSDRKRRFLLSAVGHTTLGTHAKQGPSTGHSAVGLRQAGNSLLTPRPHFTAPSCTLGNQAVGASDGAPFRQESRPTRVCRTPGAGSGLLAEARPKCLPESVPNLVVSFCLDWDSC